MTLSSIQKSCTGPEFALGEVYGVRQWMMSRGTNTFRLHGHHGVEWFPQPEHTMMCNQISHTKAFSLNISREMLLLPFERFYPLLTKMIYEDSGVKEYIQENEDLIKIEHARWGMTGRTERYRYKNFSPPGGWLSMLAYVDSVATPRGLNYLSNQYALDLRCPSSSATISRGLTPQLHDRWFRWTSESSYYAQESIRTDNETRAAAAKDKDFEFKLGFEVDFDFPVRHDYQTALNPECTCGFYAYTYTDSLINQSIPISDHTLRWAQSNGSVFGIVKGYGHTIIGSKGFRASKVQIMHLTMPQHLFGGNKASWREQAVLDRPGAKDFLTDFLPPSGRLYESFTDFLSLSVREYGIKPLVSL